MLKGIMKFVGCAALCITLGATCGMGIATASNYFNNNNIFDRVSMNDIKTLEDSIIVDDGLDVAATKQAIIDRLEPVPDVIINEFLSYGCTIRVSEKNPSEIGVRKNVDDNDGNVLGCLYDGGIYIRYGCDESVVHEIGHFMDMTYDCKNQDKFDFSMQSDWSCCYEDEAEDVVDRFGSFGSINKYSASSEQEYFADVFATVYGSFVYLNTAPETEIPESISYVKSCVNKYVEAHQ